MLAGWDEYESRIGVHGSGCDIIQLVSFMTIQCPERPGGEVLFRGSESESYRAHQ